MLPITGFICIFILSSLVTSGSTVEKSRFSKEELEKLQDFQNSWKVLTARVKSNRRSWAPTKDQVRYISGLVHAEVQVYWDRQLVRKCRNGYRIRKEYRQMSTRDRDAFHRAVKLMMQTKVDNVSQYHIFVNYHRPDVSPAAHGGAAFLPFHREYLYRFENALRAHVPAAYLPYWDSTLDQFLPDPTDSVLWSQDLLGNSTGVVTTGAFANWPVVSGCGTTLTRNAVEGSPTNLLFEDSDIDHVLSLNTFQEINTDTSVQKLEMTHGAAHAWVGGHMNSITCSPSDPIFWMHHAFVDCVWEAFRQTSQTTPLDEYPDHTGSDHYPNATMGAFTPLTNKNGLMSHYSRCYSCKNRPSCCSKDSDCGNTEYLFCDRGRCKSKVQVEGNCTGLPPKACYSPSTCINNICRLPKIKA